MKKHFTVQTITEEHGVVAPIVAVCIVALIAVSSLAIDIAHFYVARNELQNAADAGALAGAGVLLNADGTVNTNANTMAYNAATQNNSEKSSVEVQNYASNAGDVQRGHWTFASYNTDAGGSFAANDGTAKYNLVGKSYFPDLNSDPAFVNAVKVTARREATPVVTFLAGIFGVNYLIMERSAVGFLGMAGSVRRMEVDEPVIICKESIIDDQGKYQCNTGRMINSGNNVIAANTAGWTDFTENQATFGCSGGASASEVRDVISCTPSDNPVLLHFGYYLDSNGGEVQSAYDKLFGCWTAASDTDHDGLPDVPWNLVLPVVECGDSNNVGNCNKFVGVVKVSLLWMNRDSDPQMNWVPVKMAAAGDKGPWTATYQNTENKDVGLRQANFDDFINHFNLKNVNDLTATHQKKALYFLPSCDVDVSVGGTGGENYGIRAKNPVLVH